MSTSSEEISYTNSFCGHCRFFGHCATEYGDHACWEFIAEDFCANNDATG